VLVSDRARQLASGIAGLAVLRALTLAVPGGSFHFPGKLSGGLDTLRTKPTRPVWLTTSRGWHEMAGRDFLFFAGA